jgi:two-component system, OmpR family, phosphate regulon sensor histidine kinase PhoR
LIFFGLFALSLGSLLIVYDQHLLAAVLFGGAFSVLLIIDTLHIQRLSTWFNLPTHKTPLTGFLHWRQLTEKIGQQYKDGKSAQQELELEVKRLQAAVNQLPDALIVLDRFHHVEWYNHQAGELLEIVGQRRPIGHFVRAIEFSNYMNSGRQAQPVILSLGNRPGRKFQFSLHADGADYFLLTARDVTDQEHLNDMRKDFVANVSHEIRTPLTVVAGFAETMLNIPLAEATRNEYLRTILKQAGTMHQLVEDLLTLSTLQSVNSAPDTQEHDLHDLIHAHVADAKVISGGQHSFETRLEGPKSAFFANKELSTAVRNLLTNAIRYTPPNGKIVVSTQVRDFEHQISISDTGIGISPEHLPRLTERFYRVDRGRSRDSGGTGLGLAIVKHSLQRMNARLMIDSTIGEGSKFTIVLPKNT